MTIVLMHACMERSLYSTTLITQHSVILGLVQTSLFSCVEPNANELEQRILLIYIRFGA